MPDLSITRQLLAGLTWNSSKTWFENYDTIKNHRSIMLAGKLIERTRTMRKEVKRARKKHRSIIVPLAVCTFDIINMFAEVISDVGTNYFDSHGWITPFSNDFSGMIYDVYKAYPRTVHNRAIPNDKDDSDGEGLPMGAVVVREPLKLNFVEIAPGIEIGWQDSWVRNSPPSKIYCRGEHVERVRTLVSEQLWQAYKNVPCVLVKRVVRMDHNKHYDDGDGTNLTFNADDLHTIASSERTERIVENYRRAAEVGLARSLMLNGPPGAGKSTMAQAIIRQLGYRTLRFCVEDLSERYVPSIMECIRIFRPDERLVKRALVVNGDNRQLGVTQEPLRELEERTLRIVIAPVEVIDDDRVRPEDADALHDARHVAL
jgi:hypothetical protein